MQVLGIILMFPEMMSGDEYVQLAMENARALNNNNYKTLEEFSQIRLN